MDLRRFRGMRIDDRRADIGVGILIIFIAILLITGIVVTALVDTTSLFTRKAAETGKESKTQVTTGINVISVSGNLTDSGITEISILIEPITGSGIVNVDTTIIRIAAAGNPSAILKYNRTSNSYGDGFFNVSRWLRINGDASDRLDDPYIEYGDMIEIGINTTADASIFSPNTDVTIEFLLEAGHDARIEFRTPLTYLSGEYVELY